MDIFRLMLCLCAERLLYFYNKPAITVVPEITIFVFYKHPMVSFIYLQYFQNCTLFIPYNLAVYTANKRRYKARKTNFITRHNKLFVFRRHWINRTI